MNTHFLKIACLVLAFGASAQIFAQVLPKSGIVTSGQATIIGNKLTITNPGTNINWQSFNIGTGNTTQFIQQSPSSMAFNRVTGSTPSPILGTMVSNGKVFAINPNSAKPEGTTRLDTGALVLGPSGAFQVITGDGAHAFRSLTPPPNAATQAVMGADGVIRLTAAKP